MGFFQFFQWGLVLQAIAIVHFIRRRPDTFWLYVIIFLGGLGAAVYIVVEMVPDLGLLRLVLDSANRRKRIRGLEALVVENPASGNYEELADLLLDEGKFARARECYDKAITSRTTHLDPLYRRGIAEVNLGDFTAAAADFEAVTSREPKYDSHRAMALLAHAYANSGRTEKAAALFQQVTEVSTLSETYLNYAEFLAAQGHKAEARGWAERVLSRKAAMPRYLQRRERPWFRKAKAILKRA